MFFVRCLAAPNSGSSIGPGGCRFPLANSFWLAAPVAAASEQWGRLRQRLVATARHGR